VRLVAVEARISEPTPRDLRGVRDLARALAPPEPTIIAGRKGPFGDTPWAEDVDASRPVLAAAGDHVAAALRAGAPCVTLQAAALLELLAAVARGPVLGVEITAFHGDDDERVRARVAGLLVDAVGALSLGGAASR